MAHAPRRKPAPCGSAVHRPRLPTVPQRWRSDHCTRTTPATKAVVKDIAALCNEAKTKLDEFAKVDPTLGLAAHGLPKYEQQTREAIEATTTKRLLFASGDTFEIRLLQTQAQSTDYLAHLALLLSENDKDPERAAYMKQLSENAQKYYKQVMARLAVNKASDTSAKDSDQAKVAE